MNKKIMKSFMSLGLIVCMLFGMCACGGEKQTSDSENHAGITDNTTSVDTEDAVNSQYPDYINLDGYRPIVKEGEKVTLKVAVGRNASAKVSAEDAWFTKFIEEKLNIDLEIIELNDGNVEERRNLMLTSGNLPDIMWGIGIGTTDIVNYGVDGELLLPVSDYIDETLTPNLVQLFENFPYGETVCTAPDGKMYTVPKISYSKKKIVSDGQLANYRVFIDETWLEAAGITEVPQTLDGFLEMCRTFKAMDPSVMGVDEIWPIVTTDSGYVSGYLANAFGWYTSDFSAYNWDVQKEQIVIPAMEEKYKDYVTFMNTLYTEGLIHPDYYTMDSTAAQALYAEGKAPIMAAAAPYVYLTDTWSDWIGAAPLASEYNNDEAFAVKSRGVSIGEIYISADTEYPELCMRFLDYLYSAEGVSYMGCGCPAWSDDTLGMISGYDYDSDTGEIVYDDLESGKFEDKYTMMVSMFNLGVSGLYVDMDGTALEEIIQGHYPDYQYKYYDYDEYVEVSKTNPDTNYRIAIYDVTKDKTVDPLPVVYKSAEENERFTDLYTVIDSYVDQETAKFVTGQRPLSELDDFQEELKSMDIDEYLELCQSFFANYEK